MVCDNLAPPAHSLQTSFLQPLHPHVAKVPVRVKICEWKYQGDLHAHPIHPKHGYNFFNEVHAAALRPILCSTQACQDRIKQNISFSAGPHIWLYPHPVTLEARAC